MRRLRAMKAGSREPQSWTMACLVASEVVSGPGVSRNGSPVGVRAGPPVAGAVVGVAAMADVDATQRAITTKRSELRAVDDTSDDAYLPPTHKENPS